MRLKLRHITCSASHFLNFAVIADAKHEKQERAKKPLFYAKNGLVSTLKVLSLVEISVCVKLHLATTITLLHPPNPLQLPEPKL
jgi:hypothetical protein